MSFFSTVPLEQTNDFTTVSVRVGHVKNVKRFWKRGFVRVMCLDLSMLINVFKKRSPLLLAMLILHTADLNLTREVYYSIQTPCLRIAVLQHNDTYAVHVLSRPLNNFLSEFTRVYSYDWQVPNNCIFFCIFCIQNENQCFDKMKLIKELAVFIPLKNMYCNLL